jgi:acyl dehydratase
VASEYWLHVQWNWTPTAGGTTAFGVCVAALADVAAQQSKAAMGAMRRRIARGRLAPLQVGSFTHSGEILVTFAQPATLLRMKIGDQARRTRTVTARDIELFTELTGDRNPLHYEEAAANASRFGGIIVQGGVTTGLLNAVVAEDLPGPGSVFLHVEWDFKAPVRPGDEITAEVEVLEAREDKPITKLRTTITNQEGVVVLDGEALVWTEPI